MTEPMFLLCRGNEVDAELLGAGAVKVVIAGGWRLAWKSNGAVEVSRNASTVTVRVDDAMAGAPTELLRWDIDRQQVHAHRPWPGLSSLYVAPHGQCVATTHLRYHAQLDAELRPAPRSLAPGMHVSIDLATGCRLREWSEVLFDDLAPVTIDEAGRLLKTGLRAAIDHLPDGAVLLLSGGIDSAALAVLCAERSIRALTWVLKRPAAGRRNLIDDVGAAILVAQHCHLDHTVLELDEKQLERDIEAAVLLSETRRGTFVDDAVVYLQVARALRMAGVTSVIIGEAADDVFGCLPMHLRYYQGEELLAKLRQDLAIGAPADHAAIRRIFGHFGIEALDPYLSFGVARLGASLPLEMRIDSNRRMKPVLRRAFETDLPDAVVTRQKQVSRDVSGVKEAMARFTGYDRERCLGIYNRMFREKNALQPQRSVLSKID